MVHQGTWLVPTFTVLRKIAALGELDPCPVPAYMPEKALFLLKHQKESFQKALSGGVKMALGTDCGGFGHGQNAGELKYLVEAGMTPLQAITAGTGMGAECMGLGEETGVLREGLFADLLVVDGDPLKDVTILESRDNLRLIMKNGDIIKNTLDKKK
jgi:imidazolonepropionase-like amidohydrolase